ncbi:MAG: proton-conducting transporter membrane subunit, partial [Byssovorax sp.]
LADAKDAGIGLEAGIGTLAALGLTLSAMGKAAQFPVGGWLVRAMEGPTPSSALYYGALSVHTGIFLLLRAEPILRSSVVVSTVLVVVGLGTAVVASALGRVQTDAKSALAYACRAQLGLMFLECGLGFYRLAAWHMLGHAGLRAFQMLRAPSILHDHVRARAAAREPVFAAPNQGSESPLSLRTYAAAHHGFYVSVLAERLVAVPMAWISQRIEALELFWTRPLTRLDSHRSDTQQASLAGLPKPGPSAPSSDEGDAS